MYIKSMVIDGFKSYGQRTEINGFDPLFNAITGLNGSGKSNILDAICFLLGITNLTHVRATNLQELVYKNGQAGVTKATVTVVFDNRDKAQSPLGYEQFNEITISRQVIIGGKTKYLINGSNVQNNRAQDFFRSVQLNVNNPHFLIMQGRITKVLNMKPPEILAMIEEAAGTRLYESKKQQSLKTIEKKDTKLREINEILAEEVTPTLNKLRDERSQYLEFQKMERELEHLNRLYVAYKFMSLEQVCSKAKEDYEKLIQEKENIKTGTKDWQDDIGKLIGEIAEMQRARDSIGNKQMANLEQQLKQQEEAERKAESKVKIIKDSIKQEEKKIKELQKNIANDTASLNTKENEAGKIGETFEKLRKAEQEDSEALEAAKKRFQEVSSGLLASDSGEAATIPEQVMNAKKKIAESETLLKQSQMKMKHIQGELKIKEPELKKTEKDYQVNVEASKKLENEVKRLEAELAKQPYSEEREAELQNTRRSLQHELQNLREKMETIETRFPQLNFRYNPPDKNFNKNSVKGPVCNLFTVKDVSSATALEVSAGGRLFNVVVDTDETARKILDKGQLQTRVTFIPLNKIESGGIDGRTASLAKNLVGKENVDTAISLIGYPAEVSSAMEYIFGRTFVCKTMDHARKVTFHENIMKKCVTLDGDVVDPAGILSGGSRSNASNTLLSLAELREMREKFEEKQQQLKNLEKELSNMQSCSDEYRKKKQVFDVKSHELRIIQQRLEQTAHHRQIKEIEQLREELEKLQQTVTECTETIKEGGKKVKELEEQLKNADKIREKQLQQVEEELKRCQKKAEASRAKWKEHERDADGLKLEIDELKKSIETGQTQLQACENTLADLKNQLQAAGNELLEQQDQVAAVKQQIKEHKDNIAAQNRDISQKIAQKEKLESQVNETEVRLKQLEHQLTKSKEEANDAQQRVAVLVEKYEWIEEEKHYFGKPNSNYDFSQVNGSELGARIAKLEEGRKKLSRNVNVRAMNMLGQAEIQYNDLLRRKRIVEDDKAKIETVIEQLDQKKKETLMAAWEQVNKDFGSIFSTLLPGTSAKLKPPEGQSVLDGLEVKVAFGGVWKESLSELSGGQRSLVALSLILAMLRFKPAPIYILDEVDAALDLSHTQNIGVMLKQHFKQSQFIVVSLKDGMFNNANVLFKTRFVDGMSGVARFAQQTSH